MSLFSKFCRSVAAFIYRIKENPSRGIVRVYICGIYVLKKQIVDGWEYRRFLGAFSSIRPVDYKYDLATKKDLCKLLGLSEEHSGKLSALFSMLEEQKSIQIMMLHDLHGVYFALQNKRLKEEAEINNSCYPPLFLLFVYDYFCITFKWGVNLGDYVQTIATRNAIQAISPKARFSYFDRDNLSNYDGSRAYVIMQGWFSHLHTFLPNNRTTPLFFGFHLTPDRAHDFINFVKYNTLYFEKRTVGCRDLSTLHMMEKMGISCYLSRCLTLTLPKRVKSAAQDKVFIVDVPEYCLEMIPPEIKQNAVHIHQRDIDGGRERVECLGEGSIRLKQANQLLTTYRDQAKLIITTALHCASPCTAMGIPVILIDVEENNTRFGALRGILPIYRYEDLRDGRVNYHCTSPDIEPLKQAMLERLKCEYEISQGIPPSGDVQHLEAFIREFTVTETCE